MTGQTVTIRKILPASREEVFDAWLDPEGMRRWMCPGPVTSAEVTLEPRVGGRFRIVMSAPNATFVKHRRDSAARQALDAEVRLDLQSNGQ
jgi:uncharacterized protein YndB with AHSA1/START domain